MPLPELFKHIDYDSDPLQIVKKALNEFNNSHFPEFVRSLVVDKEGGGGEHPILANRLSSNLSVKISAA